MLQIGPYKFENSLALAPMAGVTDSVFRDICIEHGAGYVVSEMVSSDTTLHDSSKTRKRILKSSYDIPHAVQIVGSDPEKLAQAAQYNVAAGADIIDINMGCPAKKVCNKLAGSALLEDEKLVARILTAVVGAVSVPVTLKIRTGPDRDRRNGVEIAKIAEACGIQMLAVHGRTRADRFKGEAEYDTIASIKQQVAIPVLANGDIRSADEAIAVIKQTNADGVMIGRAAQGNPWLFQTISNALSQGSTNYNDYCGADVARPTVNEALCSSDIYKVVNKHIQMLHELYGEYRGLRIARKHISWYCKNKRGSAAFRDAINTVESAEIQLRMLEEFFAAEDNSLSNSVNSSAFTQTVSDLKPDWNGAASAA